jgi:two-component system LytT family response regulator
MSMRVLIIEDEPLAAARLEEMVKRCDPSVTIAGRCDSVKESVGWLGSNSQPDLIFLDVQLGDGLSFEIFDRVVVDCPVIFTTAYDAYAIDAFRLNSISYLLKPIKQDELETAIAKYRASPYFSGEQLPVRQQQIAFDMVRQMLTSQYKKRFMVKTGQHIRSIATDELLCFYSMEKATYAMVQGGRTVLLDYTLEQLEELLDPGRYFRISRKYIVSVDAIDDIITYSGSRLKLRIRNCPDDDVFVSRERVQQFKEWLNR